MRGRKLLDATRIVAGALSVSFLAGGIAAAGCRGSASETGAPAADRTPGSATSPAPATAAGSEPTTKPATTEPSSPGTESGTAAALGPPPEGARLEVLLPPGQTARGVTRLPPIEIREGMDHDAPAIVVDTKGRVFVAVVSRAADDTETIYLREAASARGDLGPARPVTAGAQAWNPVLAAGPDAAVWLAWCGREARDVRGDHRRAVYLRRLKPLADPIVVADGPGRQCDPALDVAPDGTVHLAWEAEDRIAWRAYDAMGSPLGSAQTLSEGPLDRRPALLADGTNVHVAWDRLVDHRVTGAIDPRYEVLLRTRRGEGGWGEAVIVDTGEGIAAAPTLAASPGGDGVLVAYHASDRHALVKWWRLRRVDEDGGVQALALEDAAGEATPAGEQQGAEFPALSIGPGGRVALFTRPSHGAYLHVVDASGVSPPLDLTRRGWGARGVRARTTFAGDGTLLMVRRARHEAVLERFVFDAPGAGPPPFDPVTAAPVAAGDAVPPPDRPVDPGILGEARAGHRLVFGDVHMHSALSDGTGPADEAYARARVRGLDFAVLTDHDYIVGSRMFPSKYAEIAWITDWFDRLDGFATVHAFEWTTPVVPRGSGHRNVYFRGHAQRPIPGSRDGYPDTPALNRALANEQAFTAPHHAAWTGTDWENFDESIQRHFEIVSVHGVFERPSMEDVPLEPRGDREEGFAAYGLAQGHVFGFLGGSDAHGLLWHHGLARRPDPWDQGLTAVVVPKLERGALWDALHARLTHATSGALMQLQVSVGDVPMGGEGVVESPPEVRWRVEATADLWYLMILRDGEPVHRRDLSGRQDAGRWRDEDAEAGRHSYYVRVVQGEGPAGVDVAWSSPAFVDVTEKRSER